MNRTEVPSLLVGPSDGRMAVGRTSRPTSESTVGRAKTCQDSSSLGSAARRLGQKDASETRSHSAEQTRGAWRVPRVPGWSTRLGRVRATRPKSCTCRVATNLTAVPRSSNSEGAGATVEELRSRVFATNPCNAKRFISHAEGEQLQEGALAGLQAGGRRGHGPLGVLPKCFDDRADERGGDGRAGPHGRRPGALPPFPFSASWQGRCCEGAAVQALLCRRFLAGLPGVPPEQCHRLHLREPRVPRTPCGAPITTPRGRSFPHSRIGLLADFMLVQALLLPANLEQGHYCMPTSGPRRHVGQG